MNFIIIFKSLTLWLIINGVLSEDHWALREDIIYKEKSVALGSSIKLEGVEECVNNALMMLKLSELDRAMENPNHFYPSVNFLKSVKYIDTSDVYNFIQKMPKGAALHLHDMAMASPQYLYKLTFTENLFVCWTKNNRLLLNFFLFHVDNRCEWIPLEVAREEEGFEELLQSQLSMATSIYKASKSNQVAWNELLGTFATIEGLISYKPIFTSYLTEVLTKIYEDNIMYIELRTMLLPIYDLEGNDYSPSDVATLLKEVLEDFKCSHNDFLGGKIIYSPSRMIDQTWMERYMEIMDELASEHSDFVAGFDLMGQEDLSYPLSRFVGTFQGMKSKVNFFFSAGETNWIGANADLNLYDAILMHPTRIGHAFTLFGHPEILKLVKEQDIAIELCPISNQMMMLVDDLRNHPGKFLISHGYPVIISSDNPGFWGARTLSHDWYMVFMAMADRMADLRLLKKLAMNSIEYSTITDKTAALQVWNEKWNSFIKKMEQMCEVFDVDNLPENSDFPFPESSTSPAPDIGDENIETPPEPGDKEETEETSTEWWLTTLPTTEETTEGDTVEEEYTLQSDKTSDLTDTHETSSLVTNTEDTKKDTDEIETAANEVSATIPTNTFTANLFENNGTTIVVTEGVLQTNESNTVNGTNVEGGFGNETETIASENTEFSNVTSINEVNVDVTGEAGNFTDEGRAATAETVGAGETVAPAGEHTAAEGETAAPAGETAETVAPAGETAAPAGEPAGAEGDTVASAGETAAVGSETVAPAGEPVAGGGETVAPTGEPAAAGSETVAPAGEAAADASDAGKPADDATESAAAAGDGVAATDAPAS